LTTRGPQSGKEFSERRQDLLEGARDPLPVVPGQHAEIHLLTGDKVQRGVQGLRKEIDVQVAQLQDPEPIELKGKVLESEVQALQPDILRVADPAPVQAEKPKPQTEQGQHVLERDPMTARPESPGGMLFFARLHANTRLPPDFAASLARRGLWRCGLGAKL
jgi:hypothetical protein